MPPKSQPKVYQLLLKTHKLTIFLAAPQGATIAAVKDDALSALTSKVNEVEDVPKVHSVDDFEICREVKEKGKPSSGTYEVLEVDDTVKNALYPWAAIYLRFRNTSGKLLPVEVTIPSLLAEEDEEPVPTMNKGKRKEPPE